MHKHSIYLLTITNIFYFTVCIHFYCIYFQSQLSAADICRSLLCFNNVVDSCYRLGSVSAAKGTTCGNKMVQKNKLIGYLYIVNSKLIGYLYIVNSKLIGYLYILLTTIIMWILLFVFCF